MATAGRGTQHLKAAAAGVVGELLKEFAVQHGKGLEAVRVSEANEQLRAEVCACLTYLYVLL